MNLSSLEGKTIRSIDQEDQHVSIVFTDGTYIIIGAVGPDGLVIDYMVRMKIFTKKDGEQHGL